MSAALVKVAGGAAILAACSSAAQAQIYRCSMKSVPPSYQSITCPAGAQVREIRYVPAPEGTKDEIYRLDFQFRLRREEEKAQQQKAGEHAAESAARREKCAHAKAALIVLETGGRIAKLAPDGERSFLSDAEIDARKPSAKASVQSWCD